MGSFVFVPRSDETYQLKISSPSGITPVNLPAISAESHVVLTTGKSVFKVDSPLEFQIGSSKAKVPLVVAAYCGGAQVGQQSLITRKADTPASSSFTAVTIPLDEQIAGVIRLVVYDCGSSPPKPVAQRLVYRMRRRLTIQTATRMTESAQNNRADVTLTVANEKGELASAVLGLAATTDASALPLDCDPGDLPNRNSTDLRLATEADWHDARIEAQSHPPAVFDNLDSLRTVYAANLRDYQIRRTSTLSRIIALSFFGALALALGLTMLGLMKIASGNRLWLPALLVIICCAVAGGVVQDASWYRSIDDGAVAFAPFCLPTPRATPVGDPVHVLTNRNPAQTNRGPKSLSEFLQSHNSLDDPEQLQAFRFPVHEYAGQPAGGLVLWRPLVIAARDGRVTVSVDLPKTDESFLFAVDAHADGRAHSEHIEVTPFGHYKLLSPAPEDLGSSDRLDLPVTITNSGRDRLPLHLTLEHDNVIQHDGSPQREIEVLPGTTARQDFTLRAMGRAGEDRVRIRATSGKRDDWVTCPLRVAASGLPRRLSYSGYTNDGRVLTVRLPDHPIPGSLKVTLKAFPSGLAELSEALDGMATEPSSELDPSRTLEHLAAMTWKQIERDGPVDPSQVRRVKSLLTRDPAELVTEAIPELGLGAKQRANRKLLDCLAKAQSADGHLEDIPGANLEGHGKSRAVEATALASLAWMTQPGYAVQTGRAVAWLARNRQGDGQFGSGAATMLALRAMLRYRDLNKKDDLIDRRASSDARATNGRPAFVEVPSAYQPTTFAIFDNFAGKLQVIRDGVLLAERPLGPNPHEPVHCPLAEMLKPGENRLIIRQTEHRAIPYTLEVAYCTDLPDGRDNASQGSHAGTLRVWSWSEIDRLEFGAKAVPLLLASHLSSDHTKVGHMVGMSVRLSNATEESQPEIVAVLGVPAGLEAMGEQLERLKKAGVFDTYHLDARRLSLFWKTLAAKRQVDFQIDLTATLSGRFTAPPSRVYSARDPEEQYWTCPVTVEITR